MPLKVSYRIISLPFRHPFTISKGTKTHQPALLVQIEHMGICGYGEAPAIAYYDIPVEKMAEDLESKKAVLERFSYTDPERFWHFLHHLFPFNSFLVCALDMAGWDLYGKLRRKPLYQCWNLDPALIPMTDLTLGSDTAEKMLEKMRETPWPIYKVKVGIEGDVERLKLLREHSDAIFRVDANEGWSVSQAMEKLDQMKGLGVELVEQPLRKQDIDGMRILFENSSLPLMADESCVSEKDVQLCSGLFHGINIKLTKCGGITPARSMIREARNLGLKVMLGCMNESTVGSAAIAHLASGVDYLDMDGPLLLAEDVAKGISYDQGRVTVSDSPGLGISIDLF
jgi:L-alanine-DL-glutamate epimerase-like enolase superfamily enzyme